MPLGYRPRNWSSNSESTVAIARHRASRPNELDAYCAIERHRMCGNDHLAIAVEPVRVEPELGVSENWSPVESDPQMAKQETFAESAPAQPSFRQ